MNKRTKTMGLHEWTSDELIVNLYITKYGNDGLYHRTIKSICEKMKVSIHSFKCQSMNFRYLMGEKFKTLTDYSKLQRSVYEQYSNKSRFDFCDVVKVILEEDKISRNNELIKRGLNPNKLKLVVK